MFFARLSLILLTGSFGLMACSPVNVESPAKPPGTIEVSATHSTQAIPDQVELHWQVRREGSDLNALSTAVDHITGNLITGLQELGIDREYITSHELRMQPRYDYDQSPPEPAGHQVQRQVRLTLGQSELLQEVLDLALETEVSELQSLRYTVSDPAPYYEEALTGAMAQAQAKARALARASDQTLGEVQEVTEQSQGPVTLLRQQTADNRVNEPGQQDITARLTVRFTLEPGTE